MSPPPRTVRLSSCNRGAFALVESVDCAEHRLRLRLADMGFTRGAPVRIVRAAPLGDPLEIEVRGYRLCLRRADAASILVTLSEGVAECRRLRQRRERRHGAGRPRHPGGEP